MSPGFRLRKSFVARAEASILDFSPSMSFGFPVLPLVCSLTYGALANHSCLNCSIVTVAVGVWWVCVVFFDLVEEYGGGYSSTSHLQRREPLSSTSISILSL